MTVEVQYPFLDWPYPIAFAHRGGAGDHPENSMAAFQAAIDLGYRYLETDVHTTADGMLVAFHDHRLDRVTDRSGRIAALPWSVVREARVGTSDERIPLLEDILGAWPEARVNVDPKHDAAVEPLVDTLRRVNAFDRVCVAAFSDRRLGRVRRLTEGRVCTAAGPGEITRLRIASFAVPAGRIRAACVQVPPTVGGRRLVDRRFLDTAHRLLLPVHVWTVNDKADMERPLDLGVDGIMTDRPRLLRDLIAARG